MEAKCTLDTKMISKVQELIEINIDSYLGLRQAEKHTQDTRLARLFNDMAAERVGQAVELKKLLGRGNGDPVTEGSVAGRIHRKIMDWSDALGCGWEAVLREAKRGENYIKAKYEATLTQIADPAAIDVLKRQYSAIKKTRERMCNLGRSIADQGPTSLSPRPKPTADCFGLGLPPLDTTPSHPAACFGPNPV